MLKTAEYLKQMVVALSLTILFTFSFLQPAFALQLYSPQAVTQSFHPGFVQFLIPITELLFEAAAADAVATATGAAIGGAGAAAVSTGAAEVAVGVVETAISGAIEATVGSTTEAAIGRTTGAVVSSATRGAVASAARVTTAEVAGAAGVLAVESELEALAVLTNISPEMNAAKVLSQYEINSPFSAIYHPPTKQWIALASENAVLKNGRFIPTVRRSGGHKNALEAFLRRTRLLNDKKHVGFTIFREGDNTVKITWKSGTVNRVNFSQQDTPLEYRADIIKAIEHATGSKVIG